MIAGLLLISLCILMLPLDAAATTPDAVERSPTTANSSVNVGTVVVPDVSGMSLNFARQQLKSAGLKARVTDLTQSRRTVEFPEQWMVASHSKRGKTVKAKSAVTLRVVLRSEYVEFAVDGKLSARTIERAREGEAGRVMIRFVGMTLKDARKAAKAADLGIGTVKDGTGKNRSVVRSSGWTIIDQDTVPGDTRKWRAAVTVVKNSEVTNNGPLALNRALENPHANESVYPGIVTAIDPEDESVVVVDGVPTELDLIARFEDSCLSAIPGSADQARAERDRLLPIGTRVVVRSSAPLDSDRRGFIHLQREFDATAPALGSVNEQLVRSGHWVPSHFGIDKHAVMRGDADTIVVPEDRYFAPVHLEYLPLILAAGQEAQQQAAGGMALCVEQTREYVKQSERTRRNVDATIERGEREYQRRKAAGYYRCRDGDGDGICHER